MRDDTKDDTQEISKSNYILPHLLSNNDLHFASTKQQPSKQIGVVEFSNRYDSCGKVCNGIEFGLSMLNTTLPWGYLAIFDFKVSPNLSITIITLILLRILLCMLASIAVY